MNKEPKYHYRPTQEAKDLAEEIRESIPACEDFDDALAEKFMAEYEREHGVRLAEEARVRALPAGFKRQRCPGCRRRGFADFCCVACRMTYS
jgi:hypothetical protein